VSVQIQRLEALLESTDATPLRALATSYMRAAIILRELLVRVSGMPNVVPEPIPSFEHLLEDAIRWAYRWAVVQVAEVREFLEAPVSTGSQSRAHSCALESAHPHVPPDVPDDATLVARACRDSLCPVLSRMEAE